MFLAKGEGYARINYGSSAMTTLKPHFNQWGFCCLMCLCVGATLVTQSPVILLISALCPTKQHTNYVAWIIDFWRLSDPVHRVISREMSNVLPLDDRRMDLNHYLYPGCPYSQQPPKTNHSSTTSVPYFYHKTQLIPKYVQNMHIALAILVVCTT